MAWMETWLTDIFKYSFQQAMNDHLSTTITFPPSTYLFRSMGVWIVVGFVAAKSMHVMIIGWLLDLQCFFSTISLFFKL